MKQRKTYNSMKHKNFRTALIQMLENDFSLIGSGKVLELLTDNIFTLIDKYLPDKQLPGTTIISAVSKDAPKGHHRGIKSLPLVPISLNVVNGELIDRYANGDKVRDIKKDYVIQMFKEAYNQGGVLSCSDAALMLKMSSATISKYVRDHMDVHDEIVPTRGFIHDIGPSISHKGIIVGKFLQGTVPDKIARETNHSQKAIDRYIKDYERIRICIRQKMKEKMIARTTGLSKSLVKKYNELYQQYEGGKSAN